MVVLDIIGIRFRFLMHRLSRNKDFLILQNLLIVELI